jgi:hypothetical protein
MEPDIGRLNDFANLPPVKTDTKRNINMSCSGIEDSVFCDLFGSARKFKVRVAHLGDGADIRRDYTLSASNLEWFWPIRRYTAGTTNSVNKVPMAMPAAMTSPMLKRETAPAPLA